MSGRGRNSRKYVLKRVILFVFIGIGIILMFYPWISNWIFEHQAQNTVQVYEDKESSLSEKERTDMLKMAEKYNLNLSQSQVTLTDPFDEEQVKSDDVFSYNSLLNVDGAGLMGYIEIPAIRVNLPILHGTSISTLKRGVGHLEGSSLPIGGKSTHTVLTGHTGLREAKLFTDLTELKKEDLFFIHVAGKHLAYKVCDVSVVLPEDTSKLFIVPDEDLATLITCTPYGVNTHRLLVTGERTEYSNDVKKQAKDQAKNSDSLWMRSYKKAALMGIGASITIIIFSKVIGHFRNKKKRKKRPQW